MFVPYNAAGPAAKPMADLVAAARAKGLWVFSHFNRIHVTPPCVTSAADVQEGLNIIDSVLELADASL
jgi:taurine--2-oxoglutarate transaminase